MSDIIRQVSDIEGLEIVSAAPHQVDPEGVQVVLRFPNGYGVSVIHNRFSYGIELAVLVFRGDEYSLTYDTPVTSDVLGYLDEQSLRKAVIAVAGLPKREEIER